VRTGALLLCTWALAACATTPAPGPAAAAETDFWNALQELCGQRFEGRLVEGTAPSDADFGKQRLVMEVKECTADQVRIPLTVGADQSRTWVLTRPSGGLRLKHDHRHADGTEDEVSQYGGDAAYDPARTRQDFPADAFTAQLLPAAATNIWTIEVAKTRFVYALRREAEGRRFRLEFDLTRLAED
jgi:hypothetical protein